MNPFQRKRVAEYQVAADKQFGNTPLGGVIVRDKDGKLIKLNAIPKTNWQKELDKANKACDIITAKFRQKKDDEEEA